MKGHLLFACALTCIGCSTSPSPEDTPPRASVGTRPELLAQEAEATEDHARAPSVFDGSALEMLTQDAALEIATENRPELEAARARVEAAGARLKAAGLFPNPLLYLFAETIPLSARELDTSEFIFGVQQIVPIGGRLRAAEDVSERELQLAAIQALSIAREVRREVRGAFVTALYSAVALELTHELLSITEEDLSLVRARHELGDAVPTEVAALELAFVSAQREERRAATLDTRARTTLAVSLGLGTRGIASVSGLLDSELALPELKALLKLIETDPDILAAAARTEVAEARVELARAARVPDLRFDLAYRRVELVQVDTFDIGVAVRIPIFDTGTARVEASRGDWMEARAAEQGSRLRLEAELRDAHLEATQAMDVLQFQEAEVLPRTREWFDVVRMRYDAGDLGLSDFLAAQRAIIDVEQSSLEARRELMFAWARLAPYLELDPLRLQR